MLANSRLLAPLANRDYKFLLISNFLWWQARWMELIVNGWLALELTDSPWMVALIGFFRSFPILIFGIFSGPIIDRFGRRACIQVAQCATFLNATVVALLLWLQLLNYWHLAIAAFIMGAIWSVDWPARRALIPDLVGKKLTIDAMLLENFAQNTSSIVGPFLSGAFIALLGGAGGYTLIAVVALLALLTLLQLSKQPIPQSAMPDGSSPLRRIASGLHYVRQDQLLIGVMLISLLMNFLAFPYANLLSVFARDVLDQGPLGLGILGSASGIGAFVGLLLINKIRYIFGIQWIFVVGSAFFCLILLLFSFSTNVYLSFVLLAISGIGRVCFGVMQTSIILLTVSDEMRSRVMGSLTIFIGAGPFGRLQTGGLAEAIGAPLAVGGQAGLAIVLLAAVTLFLPQYRRAEVKQN